MGSGSGRLGLDQHRHRPGPVGIGGASQHLGAYVPTVSVPGSRSTLCRGSVEGWTFGAPLEDICHAASVDRIIAGTSGVTCGQPIA